MERAGRAGIRRFFLFRSKPHSVAIRQAGGVLGLETLFFGDEVRDAQRLAGDIDAVDVSEPELELAEKLIDTLKTQWNPAACSDTYREDLLRKIAEASPTTVTEAPGAAPPAGSQVEALMEALKASVAEAKKKERKRSSRKRTADGFGRILALREARTASHASLS